MWLSLLFSLFLDSHLRPCRYSCFFFALVLAFCRAIPKNEMKPRTQMLFVTRGMMVMVDLAGYAARRGQTNHSQSPTRSQDS
jgi:hypothetical protein